MNKLRIALGLLAGVLMILTFGCVVLLTFVDAIRRRPVSFRPVGFIAPA